mmetsp:Transcript_20054/g.46301  ORF Transcript_20054/g.46301 Transcript_20054/m.46301 type:complete len:206 (-) Transcript_20054:1081-1698(-)
MPWVHRVLAREQPHRRHRAQVVIGHRRAVGDGASRLTPMDYRRPREHRRRCVLGTARDGASGAGGAPTEGCGGGWALGRLRIRLAARVAAHFRRLLLRLLLLRELLRELLQLAAQRLELHVVRRLFLRVARRLDLLSQLGQLRSSRLRRSLAALCAEGRADARGELLEGGAVRRLCDADHVREGDARRLHDRVDAKVVPLAELGA